MLGNTEIYMSYLDRVEVAGSNPVGIILENVDIKPFSDNSGMALFIVIEKR